MKVERIQKNLAGNLLAYSTLAIAAGLVTGYYLDMKSLSSLVMPLVFIMIYPMMVNLSLAHVRRVRKVAKPLVEAMIINFMVAPALMYTLLTVFHTSIYMKLSLMLLSIAPASSMGLGYVGLSGGDMLAGAVIVASAFLLSVVVFPLAGYYLASGTQLQVPIDLIVRNLVLVVVLPLLLGLATREYIERRRGFEGFKRVKPYFSTITLIGLYLLLYVIFASKARLVVAHYMDLVVLTP